MTMGRLWGDVTYVDDPGSGGKLINKQRTCWVRRRLRLG
jgi:hypothetical protein